MENSLINSDLEIFDVELMDDAEEADVDICYGMVYLLYSFAKIYS